MSAKCQKRTSTLRIEWFYLSIVRMIARSQMDFGSRACYRLRSEESAIQGMSV
jgi:hypothetical protein